MFHIPQNPLYAQHMVQRVIAGVGGKEAKVLKVLSGMDWRNIQQRQHIQLLAERASLRQKNPILGRKIQNPIWAEKSRFWQKNPVFG